ncbi:hypothetical protein [Microbacterium sp. NPDC096154]|uniref:hypothetical protein n=1 Tax=Microbacterium sp. NPDC096154 TaxID=3155549 RepID=UPI00332EED4E
MSDTQTLEPAPPPAPSPGRLLHVIVDPSRGGTGMSPVPLPAGLEIVDIYDLFAHDLDTVAGINLATQCDQVFLSRHRDRLDAFVARGGRILVNGHVVEPFVTGLAKWRKLAYSQPADLAVTQLAAHPVWQGVDPRDLLFRTGVPGQHTHAELARIGVAGFYGRGYHVRLPEGATPINGLGELGAVVDYEFALGAGRVLVHGGLDLLAMRDPRRTTAAFGENIVRWLSGGMTPENAQ